MSIVRWIIALVVIVAIGFLTLNGLKPRPEPPTEVQVTKVGKATVTRTVSGAGKLEPARKINVSAQITGNLIDLKVDIGAHVKQGDYLGKIDASRYEAIVRQAKAQVTTASADVRRAQAQVKRAQQDYDRLTKLASRDAVGTAEVETAQAALSSAQADLAGSVSRVTQAQASLAEAQQSVAWATLVAPADGTVLALNHRVGERIRGSDFSEDVILTIGTLGEMEVKIEVGEHDVVWLKPGQEASIEIDALPDQVFVGKVKENGRDAIIKNAGTDNEVTTFPVWVILTSPPPTALSGMSARVDITTESKNDVIAVPIQAVTVRPPEMGGGGPQGKPEEGKKDEKPPVRDKPAAGKPGEQKPGGHGNKLEKVVFVVKDGVVERRKVTTGLASDEMVEITAGLSEGEEIVQGPYRVLARQLQAGDKVSTGEQGGGGGGGGRGGGRRGRQ
jgi:HlyD family secretion protein